EMTGVERRPWREARGEGGRRELPFFTRPRRLPIKDPRKDEERRPSTDHAPTFLRSSLRPGRGAPGARPANVSANSDRADESPHALTCSLPLTFSVAGRAARRPLKVSERVVTRRERFGET